MSISIPTAKPRCYLVYALAPAGVKASEANRTINEMIADAGLPLALWHDHFIGGPGGCVIFYVQSVAEQKALFSNDYLTDWDVDYRPMVFSFNPAAFDAQINYTLQNYGGENWNDLKQRSRPDYVDRNVSLEAETAAES